MNLVGCDEEEISMITIPLELFIIMGILSFIGLYAMVHKINKALDKGGSDRL